MDENADTLGARVRRARAQRIIIMAQAQKAGEHPDALALEVLALAKERGEGISARFLLAAFAREVAVDLAIEARAEELPRLFGDVFKLAARQALEGFTAEVLDRLEALEERTGGPS